MENNDDKSRNLTLICEIAVVKDRTFKTDDASFRQIPRIGRIIDQIKQRSCVTKSSFYVGMFEIPFKMSLAFSVVIRNITLPISQRLIIWQQH